MDLVTVADSPETWLMVVVRGGARGPARATPVVTARGGCVLRVVPTTAKLGPDGRAAFFVQLARESLRARLTAMVRLREAPAARASCRVALTAIDLSGRDWEAWFPAEGLRGLPPPEAKGRPIRLPRTWEENGITWVRTRVTIPETLRGLPLRLVMGAVDDADVTYLNGREIGRTDGWDRRRSYPLPTDLVRWGAGNEICVAANNVAFGGGVNRAPLAITVGDAPPRGLFSAAPAPARRPAPGRAGGSLPLRRLVARDGVLRYADDGSEAALWGVGIYPQSWTQYDNLRRAGVDPRRSIDQDLDDLQAMGVHLIRIHVFDSEISDRRGDLVANDHLNVLDYLVAQCSRRGIYLMLTPIAWWNGGPNVRPDSFSKNTPMPAMLMWEGSRPAQTRYVRALLSHRNPYSGRRLVDEPCMAAWEIINEPIYWTFGDVDGSEPAAPELTAVRAEWRRFAFEPALRTAEVFAWFRYERIRRYIVALTAALRSTGARQPIAYNLFGMDGDDIPRAVADSPCDGVTFSAYPGGLPGTPVNDARNFLPDAADWDPGPLFAAKARLVYEFDAPGTASAVWMYPALARRFRSAQAQLAAQFQYDSRPLAGWNPDWPQHYLNLWHTPGKAVSFMIAGEAFRRLPRGARYTGGNDDQVFGPVAVSFHRRAALLCAPDCYMQAGPTDWRPLPLPAQPRRIVSVGPCPYFDYAGTGVAMLNVRGETASLRLYPDVDRSPLLETTLTSTPDAPLTVLREREHPFRLLLKGWGGAVVERQEGRDWRPVAGTAEGFVARPGVYRFRKSASHHGRAGAQG